jgi:hypothetical protein
MLDETNTITVICYETDNAAIYLPYKCFCIYDIDAYNIADVIIV